MDAIGNGALKSREPSSRGSPGIFHPVVKKLCEFAATLLLWTICGRESLEHRVAKVEQLRLEMPDVRIYLITVKELQLWQKMPPLLEYFSSGVEDLLHEM